MAMREYPIVKYRTSNIADNSIAQVDIKPGGVSSESIADLAITTEKIVDGSLTGDNFSGEVVSSRTVHKDLKSSIALDPKRWLPIMRFSRWYTSSSGNLYTAGSYTGATLMQSLVGYTSTGLTSKYFTGMRYARVGDGGHGAVWAVETPQLVTYSGWYYYNEISVVCLRNTSSSAVTINPGIYYSSYSTSAFQMAYFTVKNGIEFDANGEPIESSLSSSSGITDVWTSSAATNTSTTVGNITVEAGKGIILMLKTCAQPYTSDGNAYFYHNYHGFHGLGTLGNWGIKSNDYSSNPLEVSVPLYKALTTKLNN